MHSEVTRITRDIAARSRTLRDQYRRDMDLMAAEPVHRSQLSCGNLAHGVASCGSDDKSVIKMMDSANIGIVTAYNDMLSAHAPYAGYPEKIKSALKAVGCTAQVAGAVPAMCDGVTQGQPGMELSLFSRDVIAQATAVSLSHQMFDAVLMLGICDKIVPGLVMGALQFGHLPTLFVPAGPMTSGLSNKEKVRVRQLYAEGKVDRAALLDAEMASYHSKGTCTFYGTANSNQMVLEAMGLQLPGSSFINPDTPLREALTAAAAEHVAKIARTGRAPLPMADVIDERSFVNGIVALLASGGSTNLCIHLVAMARAAGLVITWSDFDALSKVTPLLAKIYPNGSADINHFQAAGGTGLLFGELIKAGLMHGDARVGFGGTLEGSCIEPFLEKGELRWRPATEKSHDPEVIRSSDKPFASEGGIRLLEGNLGRSLIKSSAVAPERQAVTAPAVVISHQDELKMRFERGELDRDCVIVARFQGPSANGMPELHQLMPTLGVLQDRGYAVALVTDGRLSGASGKVPAAIHVTPEAASGGAIGRIQDGDIISLSVASGELAVRVDDATLMARPHPETPNAIGTVGRGLFQVSRGSVTDAEHGACTLFAEPVIDANPEVTQSHSAAYEHCAS
ncbi:MAG: phosphogluconate dehydratase [Halieaceae bacterium]